MASNLSIFAARLRDFISICADPSSFASVEAVEPARRAHRNAEFNALALALFALQFRHNAPYRQWCEVKNMLPDAISHWTQIPAMPAVAFKELELSSLPGAERIAVFHSSGTTGHDPGRHFHSAESLAIYETSLWPWFKAHVLFCLTPEAPQLAFLTPPPARAPHSSLVRMFEVVRRELHAPESAFLGEAGDNAAWTLNFEASLRVLRHSVESRRPLVLLGTAFSFVHLLDYLEQQNLRFELPPASTVMETGGYKGRSRILPRPELHSLITEHLGVPATRIVCEYGMSELSSQAYDLEVRSEKVEGRSPERSFRFPPWARTRIVSPETGCEVAEGEAGLIRVFDLANVFSVMAIQTEDLGIRRGEGFQLIGRAEFAEARGCSLMSDGS